MIFRVPGPCTVAWGGNNLGVTKAGVIIRTTPNWVPITDDAHGAEPADYLWAGKTITVECIGLHEDLITTANPFVVAFGNTAVVGEHLGQDISPQLALTITERDGSSIWSALNTEVLPPELLLSSTQELQIPLTFLILPDANGKLFDTVPSYLAGA